MQIQKQGFNTRGIGLLIEALQGIFDLPYWQKYILFMFKISSKYLNVVLRASIISVCLSSEKDSIIKYLS